MDPASAPVITGYGAVSCQGSGVEPFWQALLDRSPAGNPYRPGDDGDEFFAAPAPQDYLPHPDIPRNLSHFLDQGSLLALDAALQAIASAGLGEGAGDARRFAVVDGLAYRAPGQATLFVPYGHLVARALGIRGPVLTVGGAEASGMAAIAMAARLIRQGAADVVIAGAGQALQAPVLDHLKGLGWASRQAPRPFDVEHAGMVAGEGAAYVVIESAEHASERGANAVARIAGTGETFDGLVEPLATSAAEEAGRASQAALAEAGYLQNQVDFVVSCADGREQVDFAEGYGLRMTFGRHAYFAGVSAIAGTVGCTLAASGPLSLVAGLEAMRRQSTFPIAGFEKYEQDLELAYVTEARAERVDCALVTSLGVGGTNVSLLLQRPE